MSVTPEILPLDYAELHLRYNAFQTSLNKRFSNGFNLLAAYTFAKNVGNADGSVGGFIQDSHHSEREFGPVTPDLRHRLSISYLYELPVGRGRRFMKTANAIADSLLGGWQVAGITTVQSGEALTATLSGDVTNTGSFSPRPNQIHNPNRGNDRDNFQVVSRRADSVANLSTAPEKILLSSTTTVAAPTLLYLANKQPGTQESSGVYYLATEIYPQRYTDNAEAEWQVKVFAASEPDGDFQPTWDNPVLRGQRACLFQ